MALGAALLPALVLCLLAAHSAAAAKPAGSVVPIQWRRFKAPKSPDDAYLACRRLLQNNARYNLAWIVQNFPYDAARRLYVVPPTSKQDGIRAPASAAYGLAVTLQTGVFDETIPGLPAPEARTRTAALIKGVAAVYDVGGPKGNGWGHQWQSALWAALLGQAGWMLWDDLDPEARAMVQKMVVSEADRFIAPDYRVPYWAEPNGHINFPGDTKAEENAWNAMILQVAVAMMPRHPHVLSWKRAGSELMVSAYAQQADLEDPAVRDGKPVREWLHGFNVRDDGGVINHNILHPDYMATPTQNMRAYLTQSLAGQTVPQTASFNADRIYRTLAAHVWPSPPYQAPGGTIYQPGKAELYYPQATDWSRFRFDIYYLMDTYARQFGWDSGLPQTASAWMRLRSDRLLAMQTRFPDGRVYAPGEFDTYIGREQMVSWQIGDAFLLQWLAAQGALRPAGDWLAADTRR